MLSSAISDLGSVGGANNVLSCVACGGGSSDGKEDAPFTLSGDILVQVESDFVLLKLKLEFSEVVGNDESTRLSAELSDLGASDVLALKTGGYMAVSMSILELRVSDTYQQHRRCSRSWTR